MANKINITPEELVSQANELEGLAMNYNALFQDIYSELNSLNSNWSDNMAHMFIGKINSAQNKFSSVCHYLDAGALAARRSAETFESVDAQLARLNYIRSEDTYYSTTTETLEVGEYMDRVTDAEYARLCDLAYEATKGTTPKEDFIRLIRSDGYLPNNDPLKNIDPSQVTFIGGQISGFSAFIIADGDDAIILFVGTNNNDLGDFIADGTLALGGTPMQLIQANALVQLVAKEYSNITVTGHSLGGYLATGVTLNNSIVDKCVAFDPPGRRDGYWQNSFNPQADKVTTYEAMGSPISVVGDITGGGIGNVTQIPVNTEDNLLNHMCDDICDALGGKTAIHNSWAEPIGYVDVGSNTTYG